MSLPTPKKGGAASGAPPKTTPTPNPRIAAIEAIAQKAQARYRANTEEAIAEGLTHRDEIEEEDEAATEQEQEQQEAAKPGADQDVDTGGKEAASGTESEEQEQQAETVELPAGLAEKIEIRDGKPVIKTKVNGKVEYKDLDAVVRDLQKYEAGDARLREAAEAKRQVDAERAEFERQKKTTVQLPPGADEEDLDLKSLTKTLLGGTEEEIEEGLKKLVSKVQTPSKAASVDPKELARQIRPIMQAEDFEADRLYGNEQLPIQYPDVYNDPELLAVANVKTAKLFEEHPDWKPSRIILEAAKQATEWRDGLKAAPAPLANRQGRKERLASIPGGRSARTTGGSKTPPPTRSQATVSYVEQLKKQRGQG
jgi:hypothetical protein